MVAGSNDTGARLVVHSQQGGGSKLGIQPITLLEDVQHILHQHVGGLEPLDGLVERQDLAVPTMHRELVFVKSPPCRTSIAHHS